jgi:alpha-tubulin suppressor-like RCC1 family protein
MTALMASVNAQAYWTSNGSGGSGGAAGTLDAPTNVVGTPGAGTVALSWNAVTPPGPGAVSYYVSRGGGNAGGDCPTAAAPTGVLSCTDSGLAPGSYSYTVTAVWHSWSATSSPATSVTLTIGTMDHFLLAAASTTPSAGAADNLTLTAKDSAGTTVPTYAGSHNLTFSGAGTIGANNPTVTNSAGTATNFGTATAITFTNGVATVTGTSNGVMRLYKAETASITVAEGGSYTSNALSVTVGAAGAASYSLTDTSGNPLGAQTAGTAFSVKLTALDAYGNTATGYSSSKTIAWSGPGNAPNSNPPSYPSTATSVTFTNGVGTATGIMLYKAETPTLQAQDSNATTIKGTASFTVAPRAISSLSLAAATTTPAAGLADNLTITALDAYGNIATSYTGSPNLTFSGPTAIGAFTPTVTNASGTATNFGTATAITFANGVSTLGGVMKLYRAQSVNIVVSDGSHTNGTGLAVTVSSAPPSSFTVTNPGTRTAGTAFTVTLTASNDAYGNAPTSYAGTHCITFSGPTASPNGTTPLYPQGSCPAGQSAVTFNTSGVGTLAGVTLYDATTSTTLKATDATYGTTGTSGAFAVNGLTTMSTFVLTAATTTPTAGQADALTITAGDTWGNTVTGYTGNHNVTFSGASMIGATHPTVTDHSGATVNFGTAASLTFTAGVATSTMHLYTAETAHIVANDGNGHTNGSGLTVTVSPGVMGGFALAAQKAVVAPGVADNLTVRAVDQYGNTAPSYVGVHTVTFAGANPNGTTYPTVTDRNGTPVNFGTALSLNFVNGMASVTGSSNGQAHFYKSETANITVTDGTYTSAQFPIVVSGVTATQISAGGFQTCALITGGTVECWGYNNYGQLGNNSTVNSSSPVIVSGLTNVTQITGSKYQNCARKSDGTVWCWGSNQYGQLGDGTTTDRHVPVEVKINATTYLTNVAQVSAGGGHTCAILTDHTVRCWGYNPFGQLGNNSTTNSSYPVTVSGVTTATQVAAGHNHTCVLLSDTTVKCFGYNSYGEIGDNTNTNRTVPTQVVGPGGTGTLTGIIAISSGRFHSCALTSSSTVYCWGDNENGELGDGTIISKSYPVQAGTIANATTINVGEYHSCSVLSDGTGMCWGASAFGQVGSGTTADSSVPVVVIGPGGVNPLTNISTISAGGGNWPDGSGTDNYEHSCSLMQDGTVDCWGQNIFGQLGDGTTTQRITPVGVALQ